MCGSQALRHVGEREAPRLALPAQQQGDEQSWVIGVDLESVLIERMLRDA